MKLNNLASLTLPLYINLFVIRSLLKDKLERKNEEVKVLIDYLFTTRSSSLSTSIK